MKNTWMLLSVTNQSQQARLIDFLTANVPELLQYTAMIFAIGLAIVLAIILITFGIFKALSIFRNLGDF